MMRWFQDEARFEALEKRMELLEKRMERLDTLVSGALKFHARVEALEESKGAESNHLRSVVTELLMQVSDLIQQSRQHTLPAAPSSERFQNVLRGVRRAALDSTNPMTDEDIREIARITPEEQEALLGELERLGSEKMV